MFCYFFHCYCFDFVLSWGKLSEAAGCLKQAEKCNWLADNARPLMRSSKEIRF